MDYRIEIGYKQRVIGYANRIKECLSRDYSQPVRHGVFSWFIYESENNRIRKDDLTEYFKKNEQTLSGIYFNLLTEYPPTPVPDFEIGDLVYSNSNCGFVENMEYSKSSKEWVYQIREEKNLIKCKEQELQQRILP